MTWLEAALRRERLVLAAALAAISALSWFYLWHGAGMGMSAWDMTAASLFPHRLPAIPGEMDAPYLVVVLMWWVMMIAMMTPSAAPLILLHALVLRRQSANGPDASLLPLLLLLGYLTAWLGFSLGVGLLQIALQPTGLLSDMMLWSRNAWFSAALLGAAGAYQFSPLKRVCLAQCRNPAMFLTRHWRPGATGAFGLGLRHGAFCLGCCWLLMLLLFVGGIMNLLWIAALTLLVLLEKLSPRGEWVSQATGALLFVWALATMLA